MSGKIILIHGPSSSGKSTLAAALQQSLREPFWRYSIDHLRQAEVLPMSRIQAGEFNWRELRPAFFEGFHQSISAFAYAGNSLIVEHIIETEAWLHQMADLLKKLDVFTVTCRCPLEELERRERVRGDRRIGEAKSDLETISTFDVCDLEIDSTQTPEHNVHFVESKWRTRTRPTAIDRLRESRRCAPSSR